MVKRGPEGRGGRGALKVVVSNPSKTKHMLIHLWIQCIIDSNNHNCLYEKVLNLESLANNPQQYGGLYRSSFHFGNYSQITIYSLQISREALASPSSNHSPLVSVSQSCLTNYLSPRDLSLTGHGTRSKRGPSPCHHEKQL
jgi:hypothetical protein